MAKKKKKRILPGISPELSINPAIAETDESPAAQVSDAAAASEEAEAETAAAATDESSVAQVSDADAASAAAEAETAAAATDESSPSQELTAEKTEPEQEWFATSDAQARSFWESRSSVGDEILAEETLEDWGPSPAEKEYLLRDIAEYVNTFTHADSLHVENLHQEIPYAEFRHQKHTDSDAAGSRYSGTWQRTDHPGADYTNMHVADADAQSAGLSDNGDNPSAALPEEDGNTPAAAAAFKAAGSVLDPAFKAVGKALSPAFKTVGRVLRPVTEPVVKVLGPAVSATGKKLEPLCNKLSAALAPVRAALGALMSKAAGRLNLPVRILRGILIGLAMVLVLTVGIFQYEYSRLQKDTSDEFTDELVEEHVAQDMQSEDLRKSEADMEAKLADIQAMDVVRASGEIFRDDSVYNILLLGTDDRTKKFSNDARSDTCILLSINQETGKVSLVSFERGMGMPILWGPYEGQYDWLTHMFRYGGAEMMVSEIRENFLVDVDRYIRVNIWTLIQLIDSIGGVDVEVTQEEADHINHPEGTYTADYAKGMHVEDQIQELTPGMNHLNGATAMVYARTRYIDSDWRRVERQRNVIMAAARGLSKLNPASMIATLDAVVPLVQTDLSATEVANLLTLAPVFMGATIQQLTIPAQGTYGTMRGMNGRSLYAVNFEENAAILREVLYASGDEEDAAQDENSEITDSADGEDSAESGTAEGAEPTDQSADGAVESGNVSGGNSGSTPNAGARGAESYSTGSGRYSGGSTAAGTGSAYTNRSGNASSGTGGYSTGSRTNSTYSQNAGAAGGSTYSGQGYQASPQAPAMTIVQNASGVYVDQATGTPIDPSLVLTGPDGELVLDPSVAGNAVLNVQGGTAAGQQAAAGQGVVSQGAVSGSYPDTAVTGSGQGQTTQSQTTQGLPSQVSESQLNEELARQAMEQYEAQLAAQAQQEQAAAQKAAQEAAAAQAAQEAAAAQAQQEQAAALAAQQAAAQKAAQEAAAAQQAAAQAALEAELARQAAEQYAAQLAAQEAAAAQAAAQTGVTP